jgi:hypothetical protein
MRGLCSISRGTCRLFLHLFLDTLFPWFPLSFSGEDYVFQHNVWTRRSFCGSGVKLDHFVHVNSIIYSNG